MRCAQCGVTVKRDPVWSNGIAFCSLECAEENNLVTDDVFADEVYASELHGLFGADDDDDF